MGLLDRLFPSPPHEVAISPRCRLSNLWGMPDPAQFWFHRFLLHRGILADHPRARFHFFSVFGHPPALRPDEVNVFVSGENLDHRPYRIFRDRIAHQADLVLSCQTLGKVEHLRFPLWILYRIAPEADRRAVADAFGAASTPPAAARPGRFALVARHDRNGVRRRLFRFIERHFERPASAGALLHNCDDLAGICGDDKGAYLRRHAFNLCPENSDAPGYVTEKLFDAIAAGCIPIYWGAGRRPEPGVLNPDGILLWEEGSDNRRLKEQIGALLADPAALTAFAARPRFDPGAAEFTWGIIETLDRRLRRAILTKGLG